MLGARAGSPRTPRILLLASVFVLASVPVLLNLALFVVLPPLAVITCVTFFQPGSERGNLYLRSALAINLVLVGVAFLTLANLIFD
jgi:hypothetical protein